MDDWLQHRALGRRSGSNHQFAHFRPLRQKEIAVTKQPDILVTPAVGVRSTAASTPYKLVTNGMPEALATAAI
jgi:hypothetical protein